MNFWIVFAQENPAEPKLLSGRREWRSNTIAEHLADRGHSVTRWRSSFSHKEKRQLTLGSQTQTFENMEVQYVEARSYERHIGIKRIGSHRDLASNFRSLAKTKELPDLIHVGNVPTELCAAAVRFGKEHNVPVVVDVRDLWPDLYVDVLPSVLERFKPLLISLLNFCSVSTRYAFRNATSIVGLTESYLSWGLKKTARQRKKADTVFPMCYPVIGEPDDVSTDAKLRRRIGLNETDVVATYLGNIGFQSDFDTVIEAAKKLEHLCPNLKFVIAGSGPREEELREKARDLSNVIFPGWLSGADVQALISTSSIGLIAFKNVKNFLLNIPNKFSEYLAGGLVISCSVKGEMGLLVEKSGCGFRYEEGDADDLCSEIKMVMENPSKLEAMSKNAKKLHVDCFDGSVIFPKMANYLETLAKESK